MKKIIFATNNKNKAAEVDLMLDKMYQVETLASIGCTEDVPETSDTLEGNALQKAQYIYEKYQVDCFADDTGLEVKSLENEPGIYSARYAGPHRNSEDNMALLLKNLEGKDDRKAQFRTVISLVLAGHYYSFEGIVEGEITRTRSGREGFGYDPIFQPKGYDITFAEMSKEEKNKISHRGIAVQKLVAFLKTI